MSTDFNNTSWQRGISLIELIMFIVIVGVGVAGILGVMNQTTGHSADPLVRKQAVAIAEALLEEIELMPSTFCDPTDANAASAVVAAVAANGCAATVEAIGPEAGETRYGPTFFNNVNDYHGFAMAGINDIINAAVTGLGAYSASVTVANAAYGGIPASESLLITVTVTPPSGDAVVMHGYRTRYSPRGVQ